MKGNTKEMSKVLTKKILKVSSYNNYLCTSEKPIGGNVSLVNVSLRCI